MFRNAGRKADSNHCSHHHRDHEDMIEERVVEELAQGHNQGGLGFLTHPT